MLLLLSLASAQPPCAAVERYYRDADADGFGVAGTDRIRCYHPEGYAGWAVKLGDCDDTLATVRPGVLESCNGADDDCDGAVDEGAGIGATTWYRDGDRDRYGTAADTIQACTRPAGYVPTAGDCMDRAMGVNPGALERCDGVDNDCSGSADGPESTDATTWYADGDGDGFGDPAVAELACAPGAGFVADATDCDDTDPAIHPDAEEVCDDVDQDCDAVTDEDAVDALPWQVDADEDGHGGLSVGYACTLLPGYALEADDCDDSLASVYPGATETCDGLDDDCDGVVDPDTSSGAPLWYLDGDGDGYGDPTDAVASCTGPSGRVAAGVDCDDSDPLRALTCPPPFTLSLAWGDLHAHTGLSHDGCEDPTNNCLPEGGDLPGHHLFEHAAASGLSFVAMTDHAEHDRYQRAADGIDIDIWEEQQAVVQAAEGGPVIPILGYEYTATTGHRTVVFDASDVCLDLLKSAGGGSRGAKYELGLEYYPTRRSSEYATTAALEAGLIAAGSVPGCEGTRWASWFHHSAYQPPAAVAWGSDGNRLATDTVVEISSEHGSSECADTSIDGCDYRNDSSYYRTGSSVQSALTAGYHLGFIGGSDNHQGYADQWDATEGGYVGELIDTDGDGLGDTPRTQHSPGALTAVYVDGTLTRSAIFDAIAARHTLAATWPFEGLTIYAYDGAGNVVLPGDDVAEDTGPLNLVVDLEDPAVDSWFAEVVDPVTHALAPADAVSLSPGDIRYIRIRAWVDGAEQRVWASPFFGQ